MKIFVFDTETTGFINKKETDLNKQPKIIQFAGILGELKDGNFNEIKRINQLINPKMPIPFESSQVHHLYDIDVKDAPNIENVIDEILTYINDSDIIIGHNIEYDENMIKLELKRLEIEYKYKPKQVICTMNETIEYCKLPKKMASSPGYKRPKLGELHKILFGKYFIGAHDAMTDVEATMRCYLELINKDIVKIEETNDEVMSLF